MKLLRSILLTLAALLFLGHSVVPHQHHQADDVCAIANEQPQDWLDYLSAVFHPDLGTDHLQVNNSPQGLWVAVIAPVQTAVPQLFFPLADPCFGSVVNEVPAAPERQSALRRGPPVVL